MTLRNAFEDVATDALLRRLLNNVNFAKDINDRMRVIVDNTLSLYQYRANSTTANTYRNWYDPNAINMVEDREQLQMQYKGDAKRSRERWTYN